MNNNKLTIDILINILNENKNINIEIKNYLIDTYPIIKFNYNINSNVLLYILLIAYENHKYKIDDSYKIILDDALINNTKKNINEYIKNISIDKSIKNKYLTSEDKINNDIILIYTGFFQINLIIYNITSKISKLYYIDEFLDSNLPFIIIKENNNNYELVYNNSINKYIFQYNHPIISELIQDIYIIGFNKNKILELLKNSSITYEKINNIKLNIIKLKKISNKIISIIKKSNFIQKHSYYYNKILNFININ